MEIHEDGNPQPLKCWNYKCVPSCWAHMLCFFFIWEGGGVHTCVNACTCAHGCVYMCSYTWKLGSEDDVCVLLCHVLPYYCETVSGWLELTILWLGWLPSVLLQTSCLCLSQYQRHMWLYPVFMWVLEILTEADTANSLVSEAFLQPVPQSLKSLRWRQKQ